MTVDFCKEPKKEETCCSKVAPITVVVVCVVAMCSCISEEVRVRLGHKVHRSK